MYTKKQLKYAFQCGTIVRKKESFNLNKSFDYFVDNVLIEDNLVPSLTDRIKIIDINATDCPIEVDNIRFGIESRAWNMLGLINESRISQLLDYIRDNFDEDQLNGVETTKEQPTYNRLLG